MSSRRNSLSPPERRGTIDPGAHELEASDSEEHYSDAQSGPASPSRASPIPKTRVERVDDKPAYGEVPGTQAYRLREGDAEPDEIAIIPDPSNPSKPDPEQPPRSPTPGGHPIPKTVVEETPDAEGSVTHPANRQRRKSDAHPDLVVKADGKMEEGGAANDTPPIASSLSTPTTPARTRRKSSLALKRSPLSPGRRSRSGSAVSAGEDGDNNEDDDFGDDFDDFEEGDDDGDFGEFDDGFPVEEASAPPPPPPGPSAPAAPALSFPIPTFEDLSPSEIHSLTQPYLDALFPPPDAFPAALPTPSAKENPVFLTPRSASLWSQLVAPPPLQPPDWIRSRIRRLFLVSLGVPVDLDEILPASSKQKKLVLPSLLHRTTSSGSLGSASIDSRGGAAMLKAGGGGLSVDGGVGKDSGGSQSGADNNNNTHNNTSSSSGKKGGGGSSSSKKKKTDGGGTGTTAGGGGGDNNAPERNFDLVSARQVCMLTDAALSGMTDGELREHLTRLEAMQGTAHGVLVYWQKRTDGKIGDREAFEGVIENLVKHARKVRK
ncbi:hypothetical protein C8A00DRAFT_30172 [Chaetomidium leptoderma]|uniref:Uncharacterized protein n=1 Tax=Chaetomidium leptoderma TaxID=669021 RepID=A0AAN6ZYQ8_9PEZI|nr:hypothetical protein C8A00DRAFT_30172 [Chaetomidium leptoderma]